jgi:hypothetical protein
MSRRLIYVLTILALLIGMVGFQPVKPVLAANNLRISQVSGEGGAPDSVYKDRFIELFNAGNAQASLSGLSLQYGDSNLDDLGNDGAFNVVALPDEASIKPGGYYLIKVTSFDIEKPSIPAADYDLTQLQPFRIIDNAYGKLALVQGTEPLGCSSTANPCNEEQLARIIDRVAYGGVNFYEGAGGGPLAGTGISIQRKAAGCQDTDQNGEDFELVLPNPRNSASPTHSCQPMGDPANLRLSQVYGGGGNSGATYTHDFIEIFNAGIASVSLDGLSLQYTSPTGTGNFGANDGQRTELPNVSLEPGQYFLVQEGSGTNGVALPTPDHIDPTPINMGAANGKVVLVTGTTSLGCNGGSTPCDADQMARIIDLVGFGTANFYEGNQAAPAISSTLSAQRKQGGCQDTDDNSADFTAETPTPRNTASPTHSCGPVVYPERFIISEYIEGSGQNKGIELYNGTGAAIDLSEYRIDYYNNAGGNVTQTLALTGTLENEDVYVIVTDQSDQAMKDVADLVLAYPSVVHFNGDDSLVLVRVADGAVQDSFGDIDNDPGSYWGDATVKTQDQTLVRKASVCQGDTIPDDDFVPALEYDPHPIDTFTNLGSHTMDCSFTPPTGPKVESIVPASNAVVPAATDIVITFSETVTVADGWYDITCTQSGAHTAVVTDDNPVFTLNPDEDFMPGETCTVTIDKDKVTNAADETMAENFVSSFTIVEGCGDAFTPIYAIQGNGPASPLVNEIVTTEGVVTANFQVGGKSGYAIQDSEGDNNPATSDGIFVYSTNPTVNVGDRLRITGKVTEYYNMTQITPTSAATVLTCSTGHEITPTEITLPVTAPRDFEQYEGMLVTFPQALFLAEYFNFDRYGEIVLSGTRHNTPTSVVEPGDEAVAAEQAYILDSIKVDDTLTSQNPPYLRHPDGSQFTKEHYFRGGDTIKGLTGIMDYNFNEWKIQPVGTATYTQLNPRPDAPVMVPGEIRIASLNVLNYFVTLDDGSNNCGPAGNMNCRGADNQEEFERQHDKIVAPILGMEADVIGLIEIENEHPNMDADGAVKHLVAALNTETADGTYAYVATGNIGTDAIKQAFIYKPAKVELVGNVAILNETFDPAYDTTRNRPSLAVSFKDKITDEIFTVSVNHLKSKGSACEGDPDLGDGQGNCNLTRKAAAEALVKWLETDPTQAGSGMYVIIGDLNSYAKEDPIDAIKLGADKTAGTADDVTNLVEEFNEPEAYGYVFDGKAGYLDHALANKKFAYYVLDAKFWHINADEADVFDYDTSFKPVEQAALYSPDAYRSSDHDPILISLTLIKPPTISSEDMAGPYLVTREQIFNVKLENPMSGATYQLISADVKMAGATLDTIEKIEFEHPLQPGTWIDITPESDGSDGIKAAVGPYPADVYFAPGAAPVLKFRITFAEVGEFETTGSLYDASGTGEPVLLASYTDTMVVKAKPTLSEEGLAGPYKVGEAKTFVITMNNPDNGMAFASPKGIVELSRADGEVIVETDVNSVEVEFPYDSDNWLDLKDNTTIVDGKAVMDVGPLTGLEITVPQEMSLRYRINFAKGGVYNVTGTLYDSAWEPDFALASLTGVMNVLYDKPVISSADMAGPYLVTREQIFNVKLENPTSGATYQQISADVKMAGATLDTNEKIEFEHPLQAGTWIEITPELDGSDGIKAAVGPYPADVYFAPGEAPVLKFRITFAEVGEFETTGSLYDASGTGDPVLLVSYTDTMVVKAKPTLSETGLAGPYKVGEAKTFVITMNNPLNGMAFTSPKGVVELSRADGEDIVETDVTSVEVEFPYDSDNWLDLKDNTTIVDGKAVMDVGPLTGLEITVPQEMSLRYRINFAKAGVYNVTGTLYDSAWEPDFALASLTGVMNVYHAPVAVDDAYTTDEDVALTVEAPGVLANDTDPDSPVLTAVLEEGPTHGTLELNANGSFTYTPELNYHGTDSFTYKASDGTHESNIATVTITINPVNDAPVALDDAYTVAEDAVLTVAAAEGVLANDYDVDGDVLSATLRTNVSHGVLVLLSDGSFTYTPNADFFGTDSFTYTLLSHPNTQDEGWTDWATVTITVTPVNDAPVLDEIPDFTIFTLEGLSFIAAASDVDDTELTFSLVDAPEGATIDPETGEFTWTPTVEQVGEHEIELCVSDGELEDCQTFKVTVLPLNQAPIAVEDAYEVAQDGVLSVAAPGVLENDSDPEDAELTAELVTTTQFGTLILNPNGSFIYVPNEGYAGLDSFTYKAFDGELYSEEVTVTITVIAPPVWHLYFPMVIPEGF